MEIRTPQQIERERHIRKKWLIAILLAVLLSGVLTFATVIKYKKYLVQDVMLWANNHGHGVMREDYSFIRAILKAPLVYAGALRSAEEIPKLVIDIKFKYFKELQKKRDEAIDKGFLIKDSGDFVPASIRMNGKTIKVKLRLKGDLPDHLQGDKWSFRIKLKGKDSIFGLKTFSIQNPATRTFQAQPLLFEVLRKYGVLTPRYFFVDVTVNGKDIGIMALEEHFSKELLESQGRRESVIIKFDETLFFDEWMAVGMKGFVFNSYRNADIDAFGSNRIEGSALLARDYAVAAGLLRGFVEGRLLASEVFDAELMGRFLAIAELWGGTHSLYWNNMRFYYNPITAKLEPIVFDSYRKILTDKAFDIVSMREPIVETLLSDPAISEEYIRTISKIGQEIKNTGLLEEQNKLNKRYLKILQKEFLFLQEFPFDKVLSRVDNLAETNNNDLKVPDSPVNLTNSSPYKYPTLLHAYILRDSGSSYLELANAVPEPVEIRSIKWVSKTNKRNIAFSSDTEIKYPIQLLPTPPGTLPQRQRIYYKPLPNVADYSFIISANIKGSSNSYEIEAKNAYPALDQSPIPESSIKEQLAQHPFLIIDGGKKGFYVKPGKWKVKGSLIIPRGLSLTISPGTTLQFQPGQALIARGPLYFNGTEQNPIILEGISAKDNMWQGMVILNAGLPSRWSYVTIKNTAGIKLPLWGLTAGVTFYRSDVELDHCTFSNNKTEDTVNIVRSKYSFNEVNIMNTTSDGFDSDFSDGAIKGGLFQDIGKAGGGDGVDVSGSHITVHGTQFRNITDKALSVGEKSEMKASNLVIEHAGTGAASKDGSQLEISASSINNPENAGLMAYIKKPAEFGPAHIDARDIKFTGNMVHARVQKGSSISIDGVAVQTEDIDVDQLYKTIMKPARRK
jgi:hypothetical protein